MDSINSVFQRNIFVEKPTNYKTQQTTLLSLVGKDILAPQKKAEEDITAYIDILYKDTDDNLLKSIDKLKLTGAYSPMKSQKLHYDGFLF